MLAFLHDGLWPKLEALSKRATRSHVAVAYLARGASKLLRLREDDVLVIDMGDASVKTGRTDPFEVLKYLRDGVRVYSVENLHAKVFVFDESVVVGSSNVSNRSKLGLVEGGIATTNAALRAHVIDWISDLAIAPVTPKLAALKAKLYQPPKWGAPTGKKSGKKRLSTLPDVGRLWVIDSEPAEFSDAENETLEVQAETAKAFLKHRKTYVVDTIRYRAAARFAREARRDDLAIVVHNDGKHTEVYPPARVVYTKKYKANGVSRIGVHLEYLADADTYQWNAFRAAAQKSGLAISKKSNREIRDLAQRATLLRHFKHDV